MTPSPAATIELLPGNGRVFQVHGAELYIVESYTERDRIYRVTVVPGAAPHCSCPASVPCKHIRRVLAAKAAGT